jgi:hypothetical protein
MYGFVFGLLVGYDKKDGVGCSLQMLPPYKCKSK